jgi:hypothetical protein
MAQQTEQIEKEEKAEKQTEKKAKKKETKKGKKEAQKIDEKELYFIDFSSLNNLQRKQVVKSLEKRITHISKLIIGKGSAMTMREFFIRVYGIEPNFFDMYKAQYLLQVLKKVARKMRADRKVYFILSRNRIWVLQTREEANRYKQKLDNGIDGMQKLKNFADEWVNKELWKEIDKK